MMIALSDRDRQIVRHLVRRYAPAATGVHVFGSRATGRAKPGSDLDLVLLGPVSEAEADRLYTELQESALSVSADLVLYDRIANPALKRHIDLAARPLASDEDAPFAP